jgi:hypothetical protein
MSLLPHCICEPFKALIGDYDPRCSRHLGTPRPTLAPPSLGDYLRSIEPSKEPDMEEQAIELPPMPELSDDEIDMILDAAKVPEPPEGWNDYDVKVVRAVLAHVNDQMQSFARAAVLAERERCARVCEEMPDAHWPPLDLGAEFAAAIRKPSPPPQDSHNGCG